MVRQPPNNKSSRRQGFADYLPDIPAKLISFKQAKLRELYSKLKTFLEESSGFHEPGGAPLGHSSEFGFSIGTSAVVRVDMETGLYTFAESNLRTGIAVVTASEEHIFNQVVNHLCRELLDEPTRKTFKSFGPHVGPPSDGAERDIVLATLYHFLGNHLQAAKTLGISERKLRQKLASYWSRYEGI